MSEAPEGFKVFIRGPLGLWPFPILNAILMIMYSLSTIQYRQSLQQPKARTYNIVRDDHGRIISIEEIWIY